MELTREDLDVLVEAVETWEKAPMGEAMTTSIMGAMFLRDEDKADEFMQKEKTRAEGRERERKRKAIMLKAKLMQMADDMVAEELFKG